MMFKKILGLVCIGLLAWGMANVGQAQLVSSATRVWSKILGPTSSSTLVSASIRGVAITSGPGAAGVFLPLPGHVATVDNGVVIQDGLTFVITDVRITYRSYPGVELKLLELSQNLAVEHVLLMEGSMVDGWQSSVGVKVTGNASIGVGVAIRKAFIGDDDPVIDIELVGYTTTQ